MRSTDERNEGNNVSSIFQLPKTVTVEDKLEDLFLLQKCFQQGLESVVPQSELKSPIFIAMIYKSIWVTGAP